LQEIVGIGSFGKVQKAFNTKQNRVCVLKIIGKEIVPRMKHASHLISEHEVLRFLENKNVKYPSTLNVEAEDI